jgi:hypothetical protein
LRPPFAEGFPPSEALDELLRIFEAGDYRAVREGVDRLLATSADEKERRAARELKRRLSPHPIAVLLFLLAVGLLVLLAGHYLVQPH